MVLDGVKFVREMDGFSDGGDGAKLVVTCHGAELACDAVAEIYRSTPGAAPAPFKVTVTRIGGEVACDEDY